MINKEYLGSNFDDFLEEEDLLADVESRAIKRVIALQVAESGLNLFLLFTRCFHNISVYENI